MQFLLVHFIISHNIIIDLEYYFLKADSTKGINYLLDITANYNEVHILVTDIFPRILDSNIA